MTKATGTKWCVTLARGVAALLVVKMGVSSAAYANGLHEGRAWQFRTDFERASLAALVDLIERKKGGYYDGFTTVVNTVNTTNIGTQINCTNAANAIGNQADNGQSGNAPVVDVATENAAGASGNDSMGQTSGDGGEIGSNQENSGSVAAQSYGNATEVRTGGVSGGATNAALNNEQNNSGTQSAGVAESIACGMDGSNITGDVVSSTDNDITGPLN